MKNVLRWSCLMWGAASLLGCGEGGSVREEPGAHAPLSTLSQAETTNPWSMTAPMQWERASTPPIALNSGLVLFAGGHARGPSYYTTTSELYDPFTNTWRSTGGTLGQRARGAAVKLASGKVLMVGGNNDHGMVSSAEVYDPDTGSWSGVGPLSMPRWYHRATLLPSGKVLVTGGEVIRRHPYGYDVYEASTSAELFDPATGGFSFAGDIGHGTKVSAAALLYSGEVLLVSGNTRRVVVYDPATNGWRAVASIPTSRSGYDTGDSFTATRLYSGAVLVVGGPTVDLYDPFNDQWTTAAPMNHPRLGHTATLLYSGKVLVTGGGVAQSEVYDPYTNTWSVVGLAPSTAQNNTAALLQSGQVLVFGAEFDYQSTAALFTP